MRQLKRIYYNVCSVIPTRLLNSLNSTQTLLPYHHLVSDNDVLHLKHLYPYKNSRQFTEDLDQLLKFFKPVTIDEILKSIDEDGKLPEKSFLLSFDDGFREIHEVVAPILRQKGVPAVFFINPAFIDNKELFYRCKISLVIEELEQHKTDKAWLSKLAHEMKWETSDYEEIKKMIRSVNNLNKELLDELGGKLQLSFDDYLNIHKPFLSSHQVKDLHHQGFYIGGHSWDHPYFQTLTENEQMQQVDQSMRFITSQFGASHQTFSFPHSDKSLSQSLFDSLLRADLAKGLLFGIQNQKEEFHNRMLHRFNAERPDLPMAKQMNGILLAVLIRKIIGKNKVKRR